MAKLAGGIVLAVLAAGVCSSLPEQRQAQRQAQREAAFIEAAGAPVERFGYTRLYAWEALGPRQMALYTRPDEAWLLSFTLPCRRLDTTRAIALTSRRQQVVIKLDQVIALNRGTPCTIARIQPVDLRRLTPAQITQRQIQLRPRPAATGE